MRAYHNLSHDHKLSTDMGWLVPVATMEVLPGDTFSQRTTLLARVAPLVNPLMHDVNISVHHWYVPNRILWPEWEEWIVAKSVSSKPTVTVDTTTDASWRLLDHMGIPPADGLEIDALPVRAYNLIWSEFYRDQDLQTARAEDDTTLARVCWEKDYFTTARPVPQQGEAVQVNFSQGSAPVMGIGVRNPGASNTGDFVQSDGSTYTDDQWVHVSGAPSTGQAQFRIAEGDTAGVPNIYADLASATGGINIDDLRRAIALQRFAEARVKFGSRYVDYLRFLGVNPKDGRLDRPEYLGGGKQRVNFTEILATAEGANSDVGDMYGHGIAGLAARRYRKMFEEHGWVLTLLSVRPRPLYQDAVPRKFLRTDPMDHWQKELEVLPWQSISQQEVDFNGSPDTVFGYVPRYDEYRHEYGYVSGSFRTGGTEEDWHMGRTFASPPTLNGSFVECTPTDRIYGDANMPEMLINCHHRITAKRLVSLNARLGGV